MAPILQELEYVRTAHRLSAGELNYLISSILDAHLGEEPRYSDLNEAIGVLECAKLELYRRLAAPYEDEKINEHGDVYDAKIKSFTEKQKSDAICDWLEGKFPDDAG